MKTKKKYRIMIFGLLFVLSSTSLESVMNRCFTLRLQRYILYSVFHLYPYNFIDGYEIYSHFRCIGTFFAPSISHFSPSFFSHFGGFHWFTCWKSRQLSIRNAGLWIFMVFDKFSYCPIPRSMQTQTHTIHYMLARSSTNMCARIVAQQVTKNRAIIYLD